MMNATSSQTGWTVEALNEELLAYEAELRQSGKAEATIATYIDRARRFIAWLAGDYKP